MEGQTEPEAQLHEGTLVPARWLIGACSVIATLAVSYAALKIGSMEGGFVEMKVEVREMARSINTLNINVGALLIEKENTKTEMREMKGRIDRLEYPIPRKQIFRGPASE